MRNVVYKREQPAGESNVVGITLAFPATWTPEQCNEYVKKHYGDNFKAVRFTPADEQLGAIELMTERSESSDLVMGTGGVEEADEGDDEG